MKKRLLSMLMAVLMIASLVPATALADGVQKDAHLGHDVLTVNIKADAATKQPGIKLTYCNTCATDDNNLTNPIVSALVVTEFATADKVCKNNTHDIIGETVLQKATCEKYGLKVTYCSKCGYADANALKIDTTETHHVYNAASFTVVVAPTCNTAGYGYVKCANCGEAKFVYGGGDVNATSWEAPYALSYLYYGKEAANVKTDDKTAVAAMFNATNPNHSNNSKLVTADKDTYTYEWADVNGEYGKLVKTPEYYAQVDPTHTAYVSGVYSLTDKSITAGEAVPAFYTIKNGTLTPVTGVGQIGSKYCPDCGTVVNDDVDGNEISALDNTTYNNKTHNVSLDSSNIGFLPYMDGSGNKIDGQTNVYVCSTCGKIGGEKIPYATLFRTSFASKSDFDNWMNFIVTLYSQGEGYGYTTADEVKVGVVAATCDTQGYTGDTYKLIGNDQDGYKWTKVASGEYTKALGHSMKLVDSKAATCQEIGFTVSNYSVCTVCGATEGTSVTKVGTVKHNYVAVDLIAPTCQSSGMTVLQCSYCKQLKGQTNGSSVEGKDGFYTANVYAANRNDSNIGKYVYVDYVNSVPHKAGDLQNVKEATCTEKGYTGDQYCVWCNTQLVKGSEVALKEHTAVAVAAVAATCTVDGTTAGEKCSVCGAVISGCETVKAEGHKYVAQDDAKAATCTEAGVTASEKCSVCDDVKAGTEVPALGHKYENGVCTACGAKEEGYNPFSDLKEGDSFYTDILWAYQNGVVDGIKNDKGELTFQAAGKLTRAQVVQMLWNANGKPEAKAAANFSDVAADAWYAKAVAWAVEAGVVNGMGDGTFAPDAECTRAQFVKMLWVINGSEKADAANFSDVAADAWYAQAVAWAAAEKITLGDGAGHFLPDNSCTRGEAVAFLHRAPSLVVAAAE